jgi:hypothetical protein
MTLTWTVALALGGLIPTSMTRKGRPPYIKLVYILSKFL